MKKNKMEIICIASSEYATMKKDLEQKTEGKVPWTSTPIS